MASPSLHTPPEKQTHRHPDGVDEDLLLIAGLGEPAAADYAAYACTVGRRNVVVIGDKSTDDLVAAPASVRALADLSPQKSQIGATSEKGPALVLFVGSRVTLRDQSTLAGIFQFANETQSCFVGIVSTFRVHLDDAEAAKAEALVLGMAKGLSARIVVFRPGHLLSPNSCARTWLRRFGFCAPLVPRRFRCCFVESDELFSAIENERELRSKNGVRELTILGPNQPWREVLALQRGRGVLQRASSPSSPQS